MVSEISSNKTLERRFPEIVEAYEAFAVKAGVKPEDYEFYRATVEGNKKLIAAAWYPVGYDRLTWTGGQRDYDWICYEDDHGFELVPE